MKELLSVNVLMLSFQDQITRIEATIEDLRNNRPLERGASQYRFDGPYDDGDDADDTGYGGGGYDGGYGGGYGGGYEEGYDRGPGH